MLVSVRLRRLAREYNMRVLSDKPKHDNFCQSGQKKGSKHTPIASGTPYSTSQPIHPLSYATSRNPPPESNKRPTNGHNYMTYSSRTISLMPIDGRYPATDESTHLQPTSSYLCAECPPSMIQAFVLVSAMTLTLQIQVPSAASKSPFWGGDSFASMNIKIKKPTLGRGAGLGWALEVRLRTW